METMSRCDVASLTKNSYVRLTCVNMLVFGIELTVSAGFSYLPPMLLKAGFGEVAMTWIMGIGPFLALISVPVLGNWSDNCTSRWGRRRPFMLGITLVLIVALLFISFGHLMPSFLNVFLLVTGAVLLNYCCQIGLNPCESLVADMTSNSAHKDLGFTIYSIMISLGGCIGYLITAIDWSNAGFHWLFQSSERTAFGFVLLLLIATLVLTLIVAVEQPKRRIMSPCPSPCPVNNSRPQLEKQSLLIAEDIGYESAGNDSQEDALLLPSPTKCNKSDKCPISINQLTRRLHPKKVFHAFYCQMFHPLRWSFSTLSQLWRRTSTFCGNVTASCYKLLDVPQVLRLLFISDLCSWTALMCQLMYYTDYVGQHVYAGNPNAEEGSEQRRLYDEGVRMGCFGLLLHGIVSIIYACSIQKYLLRRFGCRTTYFLGLFIYTWSMVWTLFTDDLFMINLMAAISGTGFAAITTVPYMLIMAYHAQPQLYFSKNVCTNNLVVITTSVDIHDGMEVDVISDDVSEAASSTVDEEDDDEHKRGFGADLAVTDAAYFLSQTLLSLFIGSLVDMTHSVTAYIAIAALFGAISCYCTTTVVFPPHI